MRRALPAFILLYATIYAAFGVASPFWPLFFERRGLPAEQLGILVAFAIFVLTETWLVPFEGYLIEKFGPRVMISISGVPRCLWSASLATCRAAM